MGCTVFNIFVTVRDIGYLEKKIWGYLPVHKGYSPVYFKGYFTPPPLPSKQAFAYMWVGLHCESVVFPDHTACTDPGNIVGGRGVQVGLPQGFFSPQLNFQKSNVFF